MSVPMPATETSAKPRDLRTAERFNRNVRHDVKEGSTMDDITELISDISLNWKDIRTHFGYVELSEKSPLEMYEHGS